MVYKYTGKPLTEKETEGFLERIRMKPKKTFFLNEKGKFEERNKRKNKRH